MIKRITRLATVIASALLSSGLAHADTPPPIIDFPSVQELPPTDTPALGAKLSLAEVRWCMSQLVRLQTIEPRLATLRAIDHYNELARDRNRRCYGQEYSQSDREEATRYIDEARGEIVSAAIEDIQRLNDIALTRRIQEMLELLGYKLPAVDGVYGTQTKEAIRTFQSKVGLPADGLVSQRVLGRLHAAYIRYLGRERARGLVE